MSRDRGSVLDASPIIFLGKLNRLPLLEKLALGPYVMPEAVARELLAPAAPAQLRSGLDSFLATCRIVEVSDPPAYASVLSCADRCVLALALAHQARLVITDDLPLRKFVVLHGLAPLGTLGLLLLAVKRGIQTAATTQEQVQTLITRHNFRVAVEVYVEFQRQLREVELA